MFSQYRADGGSVLQHSLPKKGCMYHSDKLFFEDVKRSLKQEKIIGRKLLPYLAMAVCSCRKNGTPLPCSEEEIHQINRYFIRYRNTEIKTPELKGILGSICNVHRSVLDNSHVKFMYIVYRALQKDWTLLTNERKHVPEKISKEAETHGNKEDDPANIIKDVPGQTKQVPKLSEKKEDDPTSILKDIPINTKQVSKLREKKEGKHASILKDAPIKTKPKIPENKEDPSASILKDIPRNTTLVPNISEKKADPPESILEDVPRKTKQVPKTSEKKEDDTASIPKERAPRLPRRNISGMPIEREVIIPIFSGHLKHLFEVTGTNFEDFSKENDCLVFCNDMNIRSPRYGRGAKMKVNVCCKPKSKGTFTKVSRELYRLGKKVQTQKEKEWCKERGADYEVWKELFGESDENEANCDLPSPDKPKTPFSNTSLKRPGLLFYHLQVPYKNRTVVEGKKKKKKTKGIIQMENGIVKARYRLEDLLRRERARRKTFYESQPSQKESRSAKSYTEESYSVDFKDFLSSCYEKKRMKETQDGRRERDSSALQGGHCINCLKPFDSLKAEPGSQQCVHHPGFISPQVRMQWSCCGKNGFDTHPTHEKHATSGCTKARHHWHPGRKSNRLKNYRDILPEPLNNLKNYFETPREIIGMR